jgi:hypothetical protein
MTIIHEEQYKEFTIKIMYDEYAENPRQWCEELGTMVTKHSSYSLGDEQTNDFQDWLECKTGLDNDQLERLSDKAEQDAKDYSFERNAAYRLYMESLIEKAFKNCVYLPLYLYDHSGITMNTTGFSCNWDSGQVGFIYADYEDIKKEYGWKRMTKARIELIEERLTCEVKEYDQYLRGECYGFITEVKDGEEIDSCWGFLGDYENDCLSEAKSMCDYLHDQTRKQRFDRLKTMIKNNVPLHLRRSQLQAI